MANVMDQSAATGEPRQLTHTWKHKVCRLTVALQAHAARQLVEPLLLLLVGPLLTEC